MEKAFKHFTGTFVAHNNIGFDLLPHHMFS